MERYATLFKSSDVLYTPDCPVAIIANAMVKDQSTNKVFVQLKLKNISDNIIKAVKVEIIPFSVEGEETNDRIEFQYLDLNAAYPDEFGQKQPIFLKDNTARSYKVIIKSVISSNGKWENTDNSVAEIIDYPQGIKKSIVNTDFFTKFIEYAVNEDIKDNTNTFWQKHNKDEITSQHQYLIASKAFISGDLKNEVEAVIKKYNAILTADRKADDDFSAEELETLAVFEELKIRIEEEKQVYNKKKAKKNKKIIATTSIIIVIISIFLFVYFTIIIPESNYNKAMNFMQNGDFDMAIAMFEELDGYKDSEKMITDITNEEIYNRALYYLKNGYYYNAINAFESISDYKDSAKKLKESKYDYAMDYFSRGSYKNAEKIFGEIIDFKDSYAMVLYCRAKSHEANNINYAYDTYDVIASRYTDFKYIQHVKDRMELIEKYLPYTGTYTFTKGYSESAKYLEGKTRTVVIRISSNDQIKIYFEGLMGGEEYTLKESDNSDYDYQFDDYYISENTLYDSSYYIQSYFTKTNWS